MNDKRAVDKAYVHHKSLFIKSSSVLIEVIAGIDHYAQWAGTWEEFDEQPSSFIDYQKIVFGAQAGNNASQSEPIWRNDLRTF